MDQEPVGIDSVRGTGHQGGIVLPLRNAEAVRLVGLHRLYLRHPIRQLLSQGMQIEKVALPQLFQVVEQLESRIPGVGRDHRMGRGSPYGQAGLGKMARALRKDLLIGSVIDRQIYLDLGDPNDSHDSVPFEI